MQLQGGRTMQMPLSFIFINRFEPQNINVKSSCIEISSSQFSYYSKRDSGTLIEVLSA